MLDVPDVPRWQKVPICWRVPKYRDASQYLGTLALSCSKSLWLFYLFCQLFLKPINRDKKKIKEIFLLYYQSFYMVGKLNLQWLDLSHLLFFESQSLIEIASDYHHY